MRVQPGIGEFCSNFAATNRRHSFQLALEASPRRFRGAFVPGARSSRLRMKRVRRLETCALCPGAVPQGIQWLPFRDTYRTICILAASRAERTRSSCCFPHRVELLGRGIQLLLAVPEKRRPDVNHQQVETKDRNQIGHHSVDGIAPAAAELTVVHHRKQ